jgi:hypothetical protein
MSRASTDLYATLGQVQMVRKIRSERLIAQARIEKAEQEAEVTTNAALELEKQSEVIQRYNAVADAVSDGNDLIYFNAGLKTARAQKEEFKEKKIQAQDEVAQLTEKIAVEVKTRNNADIKNDQFVFMRRYEMVVDEAVGFDRQEET